MCQLLCRKCGSIYWRHYGYSLVKPVTESKRRRPCLILSVQAGTPKKFIHRHMYKSTPYYFLYKRPVCKHCSYGVLYNIRVKDIQIAPQNWKFILVGLKLNDMIMTLTGPCRDCQQLISDSSTIRIMTLSHCEATEKRLFVLGTQPRQRKLWGEDMKLLLLYLSLKLVSLYIHPEVAVCKPWLLQGREVADSNVELEPVLLSL